MSSDEWVPQGIDTERPSSARIYDYFLGGAHNFAVDRKIAEQVIALHPTLPQVAQANRAFLRRAVEFLVDAGVRQFLDVGSGSQRSVMCTRSRRPRRRIRGRVCRY